MFRWHFDQRFERFDCLIERANSNEFSQIPNKHCESFSRRKKTFRTSTVLIWCEINCAKKPDGGPCPIAVGKSCRRLSPKGAEYHVVESRQARSGSRQVAVGTKRGAELA